MAESTQSPSSPAVESCVYFIQEGIDGPVKIGRAQDYKHRMSKLQVGNPRKLRVLALIHTDHAQIVEAEIHERLSDCRLRGEWFALSLHDVAKKTASYDQVEYGPLHWTNNISDEVYDAVAKMRALT